MVIIHTNFNLISRSVFLLEQKKKLLPSLVKIENTFFFKNTIQNVETCMQILVTVILENNKLISCSILWIKQKNKQFSIVGTTLRNVKSTLKIDFFCFSCKMLHDINLLFSSIITTNMYILFYQFQPHRIISSQISTFFPA